MKNIKYINTGEGWRSADWRNIRVVHNPVIPRFKILEELNEEDLRASPMPFSTWSNIYYILKEKQRYKNRSN